MRRLRVRALAALALAPLVASAGVFGCGDDEKAPAANVNKDGGGGGNSTDSAAPDFDAGPAPNNDAGVFTIEDLADTPCEARGGALKEVYAANATTYRPLSMVAVGARRAMRTDENVVLMDADGANPAVLQTPLFVNAIGSTPNVLVAIANDSSLKLLRFDPAGAPIGSAIDLAKYTTGYGTGGGEGKALFAWVDDAHELRAFGIGEQGGPLAPYFAFRSGIDETQAAAFAVAHAGGDEFGVASAGTSSDGKTDRLVFTRVSTTKRLHTSYTLVVGTDRIRLVGMAHLEKNFAILAERRVAGGPEILLIVLDAEGRFAGPTRRLLGVQRAFGLASSGGEIGVVGWRRGAGPDANPDAIELRPFDAQGAPLGSWVCLDEPFNVPTVDVGAAVIGEPNGYSVLLRTPKHAVAMARVDRRGTAGL